MRNINKIITLDVNSALALMQEIYNDIAEQKNTANVILKKMLTFLKEEEQMSIIGPVIKEQQKIMNDCVEKKISLVKLQSILLKQSGSGGKEGFSKMSLSDSEKELLEKLIQKDDTDDDNQFKINGQL